MRYTARIGLLGIVMGFSLLSIFVFNEPIREQVIDTLLSTIVAWIVGTQFDKAKFYNKELREKHDEIQSLFNNSHSFLFTNDLVNKKITVSKGIEDLIGYTTEDFTKNYDLWINMVDTNDQDVLNQFYQQMLSGVSSRCEMRITNKDGKVNWLELIGNPMFDRSNHVVKITGLATDITSRKQWDEQLRHLAYYDVLTGLPNRYLMNEHLEKFLEFSKRYNTKLAILFLDLDRFKFINDSMGHDMGDVLLKQVTARLSTCVRAGDVVARQGGDEFIILLQNIDETQVKVVAERIIDSFKRPFLLNHEEFFSSTSIGISLFPINGEDKETLIKHADTAMYLAKKRGRNNFQFYTNQQENIMERKNKLEKGLRRALENSELILHYQPQVELTTEEWHGIEVLLRWNHPELGLIPPSEFIPIAEETGLIVPIGRWVMETACKQTREWQTQGYPLLKVAVNVSSLQFQEGNFPHTVHHLLSKYQLAPASLELEITESVMLNVEESFEILHQLKEMGIKTSIDDFGTGYSSLNVLNRLPVDFVKIDKSFVNEMCNDSKTATLVKTIIDIGDKLKFDLIAEGIETQDQAEFLTQHGCRFGQGYFYSPPLPADEVEPLLKQKLRKA